MAGSESGFLVSGIQGFYADVMVIAQTQLGATVTATNPKTNEVYDTATGDVQIILRYFVENLSDNLYNVISSTIAPWSFQYFITYHRITGVQGA
ncbi:hypothetical protein [uncultured Paraglaciecola sp.]|uniref:hypothetical protein n=1 Tax=uncultured Paraglaciecola sp. TaxID=1765024 RepID=UPI00260BC367|nr:hypothetical protein [uncultured Paraglaciecola sp.]